MADLEVDIVLTLKSSDRYVTREELSRVCRATSGEVREAVGALIGRGYRIDEVPGEGYRLLETPGLLEGCDIRTRLRGSVLGRDVLTFGKITSTNDVASELARGGADEGTVVVAEEQSKGRGRQGRGWHSPPGTGLWVSVILRPRFEAANSSTISLAAALGVAKALEEHYGLRAQLKWPNDVMVGGRKICGILTEGEFVGSKVSFVVVGVGVNVLTTSDEFPPELRETATSLKLETTHDIKRTEVLVQVLDSVGSEYSLLCRRGFDGIRRQMLGHSMLIGKLVKVVTGSGEVEGTAHDIDPLGALIVRKDNGALERIIAGDVVRVI